MANFDEREKRLFDKLKRIARGSTIKVTAVKGNLANVRFRGGGQNVVRQVGSNVASVSPETQLKAMVRISKRKRKR